MARLLLWPTLKNIKHYKELKGRRYYRIPKRPKAPKSLTGRNIIVVDEPYVAFAQIMDILRPEGCARGRSLSAKAEIDPSAEDRLKCICYNGFCRDRGRGQDIG